MIVIKFKKSVGEIPERALGILRNTLNGNIDYSRVFIPRHYVGLDKNILPCYDMPTDNENCWEEVSNGIDETELKELTDLDNEIESKERLLIGPGGVIIKTLGIEKFETNPRLLDILNLLDLPPPNEWEGKHD
jgi:hypothetical protein